MKKHSCKKGTDGISQEGFGVITSFQAVAAGISKDGSCVSNA
jgi:hypothetical protein